MDFHDHEDEMGNIPPPPGYESIPNNNNNSSAARSKHDGGSPAARKHVVRYRECLKNHAVGIGGHAVDGCGEFLAAGVDGTLDALKCAACDCHRNFHRKETDGGGGGGEPVYPFSPYYRPPAGYLHLTPPPAQHRPLALPAASAGGGGGQSREDEDMSNPSSSGGSKKRFRTKFTAEQKEKMLGFAERLGWRIQKHDEAAVEQFCTETGVRRHVLKVWMHNNKLTLVMFLHLLRYEIGHVMKQQDQK